MFSLRKRQIKLVPKTDPPRDGAGRKILDKEKISQKSSKFQLLAG